MHAGRNLSLGTHLSFTLIVSLLLLLFLINVLEAQCMFCKESGVLRDSAPY